MPDINGQVIYVPWIVMEMVWAMVKSLVILIVSGRKVTPRQQTQRDNPVRIFSYLNDEISKSLVRNKEIQYTEAVMTMRWPCC